MLKLGGRLGRGGFSCSDVIFCILRFISAGFTLLNVFFFSRWSDRRWRISSRSSRRRLRGDACRKEKPIWWPKRGERTWATSRVAWKQLSSGDKGIRHRLRTASSWTGLHLCVLNDPLRFAWGTYGWIHCLYRTFNCSSVTAEVSYLYVFELK